MNDDPSSLMDGCAQARESGIKELNSFVNGIERDYEAVRAGLTFHWSQGPVEGTVNKIKTHKRLMYGRASFPLLRQISKRISISGELERREWRPPYIAHRPSNSLLAALRQPCPYSQRNFFAR